MKDLELFVKFKSVALYGGAPRTETRVVGGRS